MDSHPIWLEGSETTLEIFNAIFNTIFIIEAVLKIVGLGFKDYFNDKMNCFDFIIVVISILEIVMDGGGGISALRAFRLFRIFKMARSWVSLKRLLDSIIVTLGSIGPFSILLGIFIYIFSLLGMQMFAGVLKFDKDGNYDKENGKSPRSNFDTILWAFTSIF